jgi:hypothetical protein
MNTSENADRPVLHRTFSKQLPVKIPDGEREKKIQRHLEVEREIDRAKGEKAAAMVDHNKAIKDMNAERKSLLDTIETGMAEVEIECRETKDFRRGMMITTRSDTNEEIDERPLTVDERQEAMAYTDTKQAQEDNEEKESDAKAGGNVTPIGSKKGRKGKK